MIRLDCPHCNYGIEIVGDSVDESFWCPSCNSEIQISAIVSDELETKAIGESQLFQLIRKNDIEQIAHFDLMEKLGRGAFGTVFAAYDSKLDRTVAIKIARDSSMSKEKIEMIFHEARAAAQIDDPNIVRVYDLGKHLNQFFIVSEYIDGITLKKWVDGGPSQTESLIMIEKILRALHKAHEMKVIHRDIKPTNILVRNETNEPAITDFGLAKREGAGEITITASGQIIGTPAYMSPEQASGESTKADRRTDVYSTGIVLYEMLAGRRPFNGDSKLLIEQVRFDAPDPPRAFNSKIGHDLQAIVMKAIEKSPNHRFQTCLEFAEDLERYRTGRPTKTRPPTILRRSLLFANRNKMLMLVTALALTVLVLASLFMIPTPDEGKLTRIETSPPRANLSIVPIDESTGQPDVENAIYPDNLTPIELKLEPGVYLIEAYIPDYGIQEVFRTVPNEPDESAVISHSAHRHRSWEQDGKTTVLHPISILETKSNLDGFSKVTGGKFSAGHEMIIAGRREVDVKDFYLQNQEVTFGDYRKKVTSVTPRFLQRQKANAISEPMLSNIAITNVTFDDAVSYAESIGARLPTIEEYQCAATNVGTTLYPWGDDPDKLSGWPIGVVNSPEFDRNESGIMNLYSNVTEWTQSVIRIDDESAFPFPLNDELLNSIRESRIVAGGPASVDTGFPELDQAKIGPGGSHAQRRDEGLNLDGLGFRCAKSVSLRFPPPNRSEK